ncbi:MAG: hypothetical protein WA364_16395 [Candidatus Nitrosopolaris sp.]
MAVRRWAQAITRPEYQTTLLSLMDTGILTQTIHSKVRQIHLKTWVFATSNGTKKNLCGGITYRSVPFF